MADFEIELHFQNKRFKDAVRGLNHIANELGKKQDRIVPLLKTDLKTYLHAVAKGLAAKHGKPWPTGTTPTSLSMRSGRAVASILKSPRVTGTEVANIRGEIGGAGYLRIHEFGGTITPKKAKYLTIPLPPALNANGTPKKKSAREWANTFVARSKKGNLIIFQKNGTKITPLYVLKKSVYIRPRLGMQDALDRNLDYFVDAVVSSMSEELLDVS
jgi:hypothetical protein